MAKSTAAEAAITRQKIIDTAVEITLNDGFEHVTLGILAKTIGMSRSGINAHFPRKEHIADTIAPIIGKVLYKHLVFDSCESFYNSWVTAIEEHPDFVAAVRSLGPLVPPNKGFNGLLRAINCDDKDMATKTIYQALGYAVVHIEPKFQANKEKGR